MQLRVKRVPHSKQYFAPADFHVTLRAPHHCNSFNSVSASFQPQSHFHLSHHCDAMRDAPSLFRNYRIAGRVFRDQRGNAPRAGACRVLQRGRELGDSGFPPSRHQGDLRAPRSRRGVEECTPRILSLCAGGRDPGRAVRRHGHPLPARPAGTLRSARWSARIGPDPLRRGA